MTPEQLEKLPKWVQNEFTQVQRMLDRVTEQRDEAYNAVAGANGEKTSVCVSGHSLRPDMYLPNDSQVAFALDTGDGRKHTVTMHFVYEPKTERKYRVAVRTGWGQMKITPNCANVIEISEES
jgi:hypothetical protein